MQLTDWLVLPLRRVLPPRRSLDWASLLPAIVLQILEVVLLMWLQGSALSKVLGPLMLPLLAFGVLKVIKLSIYLLLVAVIVSAVLSWTHPYSPIKPWLDVIVRPFLGPLQRRIPPLGGVDVSPLVLLLALQIALRVIEHAGVALLGRS
jgi:YggT family protein